MKPRALALVLPLAFAIHNGEEALTVRRFLPEIKSRLPGWAPGWTHDLGISAFQAGLVIVTAVGALLGLWLFLRPQSRAALWALMLLQAVVLLNVVSHLFFTAILRGYSPGVVTAALVNLPLSLHVFRAAWRGAWLPRAALLALIPAAIIVHGPLLFGLLAMLSSATGLSFENT